MWPISRHIYKWMENHWTRQWQNCVCGEIRRTVDEVRTIQFVCTALHKLQFSSSSNLWVSVQWFMDPCAVWRLEQMCSNCCWCVVLVEIQLGRVMMIISIVFSSLAVLVAISGLRCTRCLDENAQSKDRAAFAGGILSVCGGEFNPDFKNH